MSTATAAEQGLTLTRQGRTRVKRHNNNTDGDHCIHVNPDGTKMLSGFGGQLVLFIGPQIQPTHT